MRIFVATVLLLLAACQPQPVNNPTCDSSDGLPCSSWMESDTKIKAPPQAIEFCTNHPESEKCQ